MVFEAHDEHLVGAPSRTVQTPNRSKCSRAAHRCGSLTKWLEILDPQRTPPERTDQPNPAGSRLVLRRVPLVHGCVEWWAPTTPPQETERRFLLLTTREGRSWRTIFLVSLLSEPDLRQAPYGYGLQDNGSFLQLPVHHGATRSFSISRANSFLGFETTCASCIAIQDFVSELDGAPSDGASKHGQKQGGENQALFGNRRTLRPSHLCSQTLRLDNANQPKVPKVPEH